MSTKETHSIVSIIEKNKAKSKVVRKGAFARIPEDLWHETNERRLKEGHDWSELIEACFEKYLQETEKKK